MSDLVIHSCSPLIAHDVQQEWIKQQSIAAKSGRPFVAPKVVAPSFGPPAAPVQKSPVPSSSIRPTGTVPPPPSIPASRSNTGVLIPAANLPTVAGVPRAGILTVEGKVSAYSTRTYT